VIEVINLSGMYVIITTSGPIYKRKLGQ